MVKETQHIEFKPSFNEDVIETLVAFANTKGGKIFVGVDDKGKPVKSFIIGNESIQNWINEVKTKTQPQVIPDCEIIDYYGSKIVEFSVPEYPIKPVSTRGKCFKRVSNSNHLLSVGEIANEHLKTINSSWDMYPDPIHSLDDIAFDKVNKSMEMLKSNGVTINESTLSFLSKYDLLRDGRPTNAAYLMFKNTDSGSTTIELGRFQDLITIKDTARTKSDILTQVDEVLNYVKKHINLEVIITGSAQNIQKWQYPMEAIREIVLNMIIHRDYHSSSDSIVKIFNDKIEFYNPGRLPDTISIADLLSNNYKSTPRNKKIAEFFKDLGLIEKYGSGIGRIVDYFKSEGLFVPEFKNISEGFQVTVYAQKQLRTGEKGTEGLEKTVEKTVEKIIELINKNPRITISELVNLTGLSRRGIEWNIQQLKIRGLLERIGHDKGGYWKIIHNS